MPAAATHLLSGRDMAGPLDHWRHAITVVTSDRLSLIAAGPVAAQPPPHQAMGSDIQGDRPSRADNVELLTSDKAPQMTGAITLTPSHGAAADAFARPVSRRSPLRYGPNTLVLQYFLSR